MRVCVLLFASAREAVGRGELMLEVAEGATVSDLLALPELSSLAPSLSSVRVALNEEFTDAGAALSEGDTVAVIPPVSGG